MKGPKVLAAALIAATLDNVQAHQRKRDIPREDIQYAAHYFQQKINHFPENKLPFAKENFTQRYYFDSSYYKPGGPVYLYISGETSGEFISPKFDPFSKPRPSRRYHCRS